MKNYKIDIWLNLGKIAFVLGSVMVLSSYLYSSIEGYVSGFKWMAFGSFFIFFVSLLKISFESIQKGVELTLKDVVPRVLVYSVILVPIIITVILLDKSKEKLDKIDKIPFAFNLSTTLVYIFIMLQSYLIVSSGELDNDPDKGKLSMVLILFLSIFVFFSLGEIHLIVNYYLTDG